MRIPSKQELMRLYPTWDVLKQRRSASRIALKHGPGFLRLLRNVASSRTVTVSPNQMQPVTAASVKRKLSLGEDQSSSKRFRTDDGSSSSDIAAAPGMGLTQGQEQVEEVEEPSVRVTRSAAKLMGEKTEGLTSSLASLHVGLDKTSSTKGSSAVQEAEGVQQGKGSDGESASANLHVGHSTTSTNETAKVQEVVQGCRVSDSRDVLASLHVGHDKASGTKDSSTVFEVVQGGEVSVSNNVSATLHFRHDKASSTKDTVTLQEVDLVQQGKVSDSKSVSDSEGRVTSSSGPKGEHSLQEGRSRKTSDDEKSVTSNESLSRETHSDAPETDSSSLSGKVAQRKNRRKSPCPRRKIYKKEAEDILQEQDLFCSVDQTLEYPVGQICPTVEKESGKTQVSQGPVSDDTPACPPSSPALNPCTPTCIHSTPMKGDGCSSLSGSEEDDSKMMSRKDPLLADASPPSGSEQSQMPSSSQTFQEQFAGFAGLRFQSLQEGPEETRNVELGSGFSSIVDSSLVDDSGHGTVLDALLPGLGMLHVGRHMDTPLPGTVSGPTVSCQKGDHSRKKTKVKKLRDKDKKSRTKKHKQRSSTNADSTLISRSGSKKDKADEKKRKLKKRKQLADSNSETAIASPGLTTKDKASEFPMQSPIFELAIPVSKWSNSESPVTSSCFVRLSDSYKVDLVPLKEQEESRAQGEDPKVLTQCPSKSNVASDGTSGADANNGAKPDENVNKFVESLQDQSSTPKPKRKRESSEHPRKRCRHSLEASTPRGAGGWEESLRQRPSRVEFLQVGGASKPTPSKKSPSELDGKASSKEKSPKKERSPGKEKLTSKQLKYLEMQESSLVKSKQRSVKREKTSTPKTEFGKKKPPRAVAKPPPLNLDGVERSEVEEKEEKKGEVAGENQGEARDESFPRGQLVFGKMKGYCWWPGRIVHQHDRKIPESPPPLTRWIQWFGDDKFSLLSLGQIADFEKFNSMFSESTFQKLHLYQKACFQALNAAAKRAGKEFTTAVPDPPTSTSSVKDRQAYKAAMLERVREMRGWADGGFMPMGVNSIRPTQEEKCPPPPPPTPSPSPPIPGGTVRPRGGPAPRVTTAREKDTFQDRRGEQMKSVRAGKLAIEEICIGCGSHSLIAKHPLFVGGLCEVCRVEYLEVAYLYDVEGYQAHCCICAEGNHIALCGIEGCHHSYCTDCMNHLVGPQEQKRITEQDPWACYLCAADSRHGYLMRRDDWQQQLVEFFNRDRIAEFTPLRSYKPLLLKERRPIRVLSLFDGLGTGMLVLKELGLDVECYYASEVSEEAIMVSSVRLKGEIRQVGDVQRITSQQLKSWGPFDLLIGGSPCNDLSIVNPARKGLEGGTGLLFFDFHRILRMLEPAPDDPRPFFWLFENVVFMGRKDKQRICTFLECHPVMIDSLHMSPSHRARYYWGNLPGMHRPYVPGADNPLVLQECLEPHCDRQAQFSKMRTLTTRSNSIRQTKDGILPVIMNGREDGLWSTELERLFGFPDHYTDVGNLSRTARQKLIGKSWCVPVIKHLLAPLKDYYSCKST